HVVGQMPPEFEAAFQKNFDWANEFALVEGKGKGKAVDPSMHSWEAEFDKLQREGEHQEPNLNVDFAEEEKLEDLWDKLRDNLEDFGDLQNVLDDTKNWEAEFQDMVAAPNLGEYTFEPNNPYLTHPNAFEEGMKLASEGGSLSEAALAFEA